MVSAVLAAGPELQRVKLARASGLPVPTSASERDVEEEGRTHLAPDAEVNALSCASHGSTSCLPVTSFYARSKLEAVEDRILRFLTRVYVRHKQPDAAEADVWHVFPVQQAAFDCADGLNAERGSTLERARRVCRRCRGGALAKCLAGRVSGTLPDTAPLPWCMSQGVVDGEQRGREAPLPGESAHHLLPAILWAAAPPPPLLRDHQGGPTVPRVLW